MEKKGLPTEKVHERFKDKRKGKPLSRLEREVANGMDVKDDVPGEDDMDDEEEKQNRIQKKLEKRKRSLSKSRSVGAKEILSEREQVELQILDLIPYLI